MLAQVTLDDRTGLPGNAVVLHETSKRALTTVSGLVGIPNVRQAIRNRPTGHGGVDESHWTEGKTIGLEGEVFSQAGIVDAFSEWRAVMRPMLETLDYAPALLRWTEGVSGNQLQMLVKLTGGVDPPLQEGAAVLRWSAQFFAPDPRAYSQALTTYVGAPLATASGGATFPLAFPAKFAISGGGTSSPINGGTRPSPPVFRIYGACTNPQIVLLGAGLRLVFNGTVPAGSYLEVDVAKRTVRMNGSTPAQNFYDPVQSTWFELPRGTSNLTLLASDFDGVARLDTLLRDAY